MALLTCENLSVGYGERAVARNLSFQIARGDALIIVGENGAGKSTLVRTLLGLLKLLSGSILWGDELKQNEIGYLPNRPMCSAISPRRSRKSCARAF
jgi:zinc transport system ATP-binding protein